MFTTTEKTSSAYGKEKVKKSRVSLVLIATLIAAFATIGAEAPAKKEDPKKPAAAKATNAPPAATNAASAKVKKEGAKDAPTKKQDEKPKAPAK